VSRKFHNLAGWLRDIEAARGESDPALWSGFVDAVEQALDEIDGPDDADIGDADAEDEMDGVDAEPRQQSLPGTGRPDAGGPPRGTPASRLDAVLDGLAGEERAQAQQELDQLRRDAMAGTVPGAKRLMAKPALAEGR